MLPSASCTSFLGEKSQTDFSSFMFHIQATSQQTLVFTPMLIKVNYFVVLGHWCKTCASFSLCYAQKFKIFKMHPAPVDGLRMFFYEIQGIFSVYV